MKQTKLDSESIKWIKENPKEFTEELIRKSELVKNFSDKLEPYRKRKDREGYRKLFKELLKKEEEKQWKKE
jgi:hypothetical protein